MYNKKKISVVMPAYNEEKHVRKAINDFFKTKVVDEIVAVDNNSKDNTKKEILRTKARYVHEKNQGYGWALRRGLKEAKGDIIFTVEPDGTFEANDIFKFLQYIEEFDVVFGTRTSKSMIWSNAKMNWFLRYGNVAVAKLLEYLFNGPCLTDVGCTFKVIHKKAYKKIEKKLKVGGSHFSPEFMLQCLKNKLECVEIPVNYKERVGKSTITSDFYKTFKLGMIMIFFIIWKRFFK